MRQNISTKIYQLALIVAMYFLASLSSFGQIAETKNIKKIFAVNKGTIVDIGNKYGDITLETWEKDSVKVEINIKVTEKNREKLMVKMNAINFELAQTGHYVVINTIIGESKNMLFSEINKLKENIGIGESQVQITMNIKLPDNLNLRIANKYGNVYLDDYKGDITLNMSNGKLKAHDLTGYATMKISFGDAIVNTIETGNLEVYYGELNLSSSKRLRITSKTSDITITEVGQLLVNSTRDDYRIRMISDFETESSWTDFSINEFKTKSDIKMNFGDLTIENIKPSFDKIDINARSTKVSLFFDHNADINFDIISNQSISLPNEAKIDTTEKLNEKERTMRYIGRTGNIPVSKAKLVMNTSEGEISIMKR